VCARKFTIIWTCSRLVEKQLIMDGRLEADMPNKDPPPSTPCPYPKANTEEG